MQKRVMLTKIVIMLVVSACNHCVYARDFKAVILKSDMPALNEGISKELKSVGYAVVELDEGEFSGKLLSEKADLLVLPNSAALPFSDTGIMQKYLEGAGKVIALNTPIWQDSYDDWLKFSKKTMPLLDNILFTPEEMSQWGLHLCDGDITWEKEEYHELVKSPSKPSALHVAIPNVTIWNTFNSPQLQNPFKEGQTLTVFYAKGSKRTNQLYVEWREEDGSIWWVTVPLTQKWQQYVLVPEDFFLFSWTRQSTTGSIFRPQNAVAFKVGLFKAHTVNLEEGRHECWLGPVGTAKRPDDGRLLSPYELPLIDTLSPWYQLFECNDVGEILPCEDQQLIKGDSFPLAKTIRSPHQRASGNGFDKGRDWRWIPLLEAVGPDGQWRGSPATLMIHSDGKYKGGMRASFGIGDFEWYSSPQVLKAIGQTAKRMSDGVFIMDGGSEFFTYFDNQDMTLGMRLVNLGRERQSKLTAKVTLEDSQTGRQVEQLHWPVDLDAGQEVKVSGKIEITDWPENGFKVTAELVRDGEVIDKVTHEAYVWKAKPQKQRSYIAVRDGDFILNGKRWRANGINYMPSSGIATDDGEYMNRWLSSRAYDPEIIKRDLEHVKDMGFNSVAVFLFHQDLPAQNLLDLLRLCEELDLKVNLSLRPGTPFDFKRGKMKEILEYYKIAENDTVFALDLAWEPQFPRHEGRKRWDAQWRDWIVERYGSVANAEKDWQFSVPMENSKITNPLEKHVLTDGPWRRMTAAYRRFLDTALYESYSQARSLVRSIDSRHHVSFRMNRSGDPTSHAFAYDWPYLSAAVDIIEPEAYGRVGGWETIKPGRFTYEYARWAAPEKPMLWAEMGYSVLDAGSLQSTDALMQKQEEFFENFYQMMIGSGADGVYSWWYPGGFRVNERSDFGIINPDGTDRPVSKMLRERAAVFLDGPSAKSINHWIEIDRDKRADGLFGIYEEVSQEFWKAIGSGKSPGLRTAATDSNSANCPLLAVGNTDYNGSNPPKYLDGFFDSIEIKNADGKWVDVKKGETIEVLSDEPVIARVTLTNLCEPLWLSPLEYSKDGAVYIEVAAAVKTALTPLPQSVRHLETMTVSEVGILDDPAKPITVTMTLLAKGRARFGPRYSFQIKPRHKGRL